VRHAEDWQADLIVVGHRGRTLFERWLIGSVAKYVINHAPCAVLIAR
jgi:nucleotide-binding universal stress UspA family protein